jgi:hypothetical protein
MEKLGSETTAFNQQQITQMLKTLIPNWSTISDTAGGNIQSLLEGKIPTDVSSAIQSSTAAQALTGGFGGSGLAGNLTARDLGLTSLGLTQQGLNSAESWASMIDRMYAPGEFNIGSMFISPQQMFQDTFENQQMSWGAKWLKNQVAAQPDPVLSGLINFGASTIKGLANVGAASGWFSPSGAAGAGAGAAGGAVGAGMAATGAGAASGAATADAGMMALSLL